MEKQIYRGYTIEKETDPWALKYGWKYKYSNDERVHHISSIQEAVFEIDELMGRGKEYEGVV
jgi:hypothetical protein